MSNPQGQGDVSPEMRVSTSATTHVETVSTVEALVTPVGESLGEGPIDLAFMFATAHHDEHLPALVEKCAEALSPRVLIGTTGAAVICDDKELENEPGVALWAGRLPGGRMRSFHLFQGDIQKAANPAEFRELVGVEADEGPQFVLLADPFSVNILQLLERFEKAYPGRAVIGGMSSAADKPRENRIIFEGQTLEEGAVGVAIWGDVQIDAVVSQGCRPIARHWIITKAERNVIMELGGRAALSVLQESLNDCPARDRELAHQGMFIGRAVNEAKDEFARGDFLIRNLLGWDKKSGAIAVNDWVRAGQTVQFHVRDAETAAEDMRTLVTPRVADAAAGALLFTCNGRGTRMFPNRHHDAQMVSGKGSIPVAGFFCAGEIGPVGPRSFIHGHTASVAYFRRSPPPTASSVNE